MSMPVTQALCIQWENVRNVSFTTASATNSGQLPAGTVAVRLVSGAAFNFTAVASASQTGSGQTFCPANVPIIVEASGSMSFSFVALTSANPMWVNLAPLAA